MRRFVMAVALTGVICVAALAGNIPTGDFVSPPPPPGNVPTGDFVSQPTTSTLVDTIVVDLVLTITTLIGR